MAVVKEFQSQTHVWDTLGFIKKNQPVSRHQLIHAHGIPGGQKAGYDRIVPGKFQCLEGQLHYQAAG
jgi:hypothetical protein